MSNSKLNQRRCPSTYFIVFIFVTFIAVFTVVVRRFTAVGQVNSYIPVPLVLHETPSHSPSLLTRPPPAAGSNGVWINFVIDESGSMQPVTRQTIDNFNRFLDAQLQNATDWLKANSFVSVLKFHSPVIQSVFKRQRLQDEPHLSQHNYSPNGGTNLLDAVGACIDDIDNALMSKEDILQRESVLVVIMTDGEENSSVHLDQSAIKQLITSRREVGWRFVFLGANIDAWSVGESYGIPKSSSFQFSVNAQEKLSAAMSESTQRFSSGVESLYLSLFGSNLNKEDQLNMQQRSNKYASSSAYFDDNDRKYEYH